MIDAGAEREDRLEPRQAGKEAARTARRAVLRERALRAPPRRGGGGGRRRPPLFSLPPPPPRAGAGARGGGQGQPGARGGRRATAARPHKGEGKARVRRSR